MVNTSAFHQPDSTASYPVNPSSYTIVLPNWKLSEAGMDTLRDVPWLYDVLVKTDVNVGILVTIVAAVLVAVLLSRTKSSYEMRAVGLNREAARFAGISVEKNIVLCMLISGALCGLAGALTDLRGTGNPGLPEWGRSHARRRPAGSDLQRTRSGGYRGPFPYGNTSR